MNETKSLLFCVLIVLFCSDFVLAQAKTQEAGASPKPVPKTEQASAAKTAHTEGSEREKPEPSSTDFCQCIARDNSASTRKIEQALAGPLHSTGLDYTDQPLQDVVTQLADEYGMPIQLDKTALEEAGIGTDSKVSMTLHNISLRSALKLMLRTFQLTWIIQDEVLRITTKESAEKDLDTCVYNVQGLVDDSDPKSVKALIDVICSCVATDTWAVNGGGQAEVRPLPSGLLVISQTPPVQEEVFTLLDKIRKMRKSVPLSKVGPHGYEPPARETSPGKSEKSDGFGGGRR
jgi:hypothetical protein